MGTAVWKGLLRFGLILIPVKLYRAAQAEKISFRQLHKITGARVRHRLCTETDPITPTPTAKDSAAENTAVRQKPMNAPTLLSIDAAAPVSAAALSRSDVAKGYEYEKGRYVPISREELTQLVPPTAHEIDIREFVQPTEVEAVYFDSAFFVVPNRGSERPYALLFEALCRSGLLGVAQIAMHSRESVVVLRPYENGIVGQTIFYEAEIRRERQYRGARSVVGAQELKLALRLIQERTVRFDPLQYFDRYRDGVQVLVRERIAAQQTTAVRSCEADNSDDLLNALEQSLNGTGRKESTEKVATISAPGRKAGKRAAS
jgi:DNA end-binding protein Ku